MENNIIGDYPRIPEELREQKKEELLDNNPSKRSGKIKKIRHKIKEVLKNLNI